MSGTPPEIGRRRKKIKKAEKNPFKMAFFREWIYNYLQLVPVQTGKMKKFRG